MKTFDAATGVSSSSLRYFCARRSCGKRRLSILGPEPAYANQKTAMTTVKARATREIAKLPNTAMAGIRMQNNAPQSKRILNVT